MKSREIVSKAPNILNYLSQESGEHFERVTEGLSALGIPFRLNPLLVRGLDYYSQVIFEFVENPPESAKTLGASQNTILAGGRYDQLSVTLGGPPLSAIGYEILFAVNFSDFDI